MKNRTISGIGIAFHSISIYAAAAVIIRLLIAVAYVNKDHRYSFDLGDKYSMLIMFLVGFFMYRRHIGLCASVNLSAKKTVIAASVPSFLLSACFALFDMTAVRGFYSTVSGKRIALFLENKLIENPKDELSLSSEYCMTLLVKLTAVYFMSFILGYFVRHCIGTQPGIIILGFILPNIGVSIFGYCVSELDTAYFPIFAAFIILFLAFLAFPTPIGFGMILLLFFSPDEVPLIVIFIVMSVLLAGCIASTAHITAKYKYEIRKEKRKEAIV